MSSAVKNGNCSRVFPLVGPDVYVLDRDDTSAQQGSVLLALGLRRFNPLQRWIEIGLDRTGRAGRLFLFHRLAIKAETEGRFKRADFFWRETFRQLQRAKLDPEFWPAVVASLDAPLDAALRQSSADPAHIVIREVFIDTHQAWMHAYLGQTPEPDANSRAFLHLRYLKDYADLLDLEAPAKQGLIGRATLFEIEASERSGEWQRAEDLARNLLHRFPEETQYQNALAATYVAQAKGALKNGTRASHNRKDATCLARFIYKLKKLRLDYPHNLFLFECVAELHFLRAKKLAEAGQLAEALADIQASLTHQNDFPEAEETRAQFEAEMQQIRVQMAAPAEERQAISKRELKTMQREAARGFRLTESYKRSDEALSVDEDLRAAHGRRTWESVCLEPLARIDHRPLALVDAFETIFNAPPAEPAGIPAAWQLVSEDNPHLYSLDSEHIFAYLQKQLYQNGNGVAVAIEKVSEPDSKLGNYPTLFRPSAARGGGEPFLYWLFSGEDKLLKARCLIAVVLVVVGVKLALSEYSHRRTRDTAYQQIHAARLKQDYTGMLDAAEVFLDQPVIGRDARKTEVEGLYSEALFRWFLRDHPADNESVRLGRYKQLLNSASN